MNLKSIDRRLVTIILIVFVQMLGAAMILPILPLYAQDEFDLSPQFITLLSSVFFAAQFLAGPYLGRLSDRVGRVPVLIVSQIGTVISFLMLGLAPNVAVLFLARILDGITGGNIIVAQAYIADITPPERKTEAFGYVMAAFGIGFIIGPAFGGMMAATFGPRIPYFFAAAAATIVVLLTVFTLNETVTDEQKAESSSNQGARFNLRAVFNERALVLILIISFFTQMILGVVRATMSLFADAVIYAGSTERELQIGLGIIFGLIGGTQVITQLFIIRRLLPKFGETGMITASTILIATAMGIIALADNLLMVSISAILFAMGIGFGIPSLNSLATTIAGDEMKGQVLGTVQSAANLGVISSGIIAGVLFAIAPQIPFWMGLGLGIALLVPVALLRREYLSRAAQNKLASLPDK